MKKQVQAVYSGRVQGIGFRFTAQNIANTLNISGWVKNCPDGTVEIVAEGEEKILLDYLERIQQNFGEYINHADVRWHEARGNLEKFGVKL